MKYYYFVDDPCKRPIEFTELWCDQCKLTKQYCCVWITKRINISKCLDCLLNSEFVTQDFSAITLEKYYTANPTESVSYAQCSDGMLYYAGG